MGLRQIRPINNLFDEVPGVVDVGDTRDARNVTVLGTVATDGLGVGVDDNLGSIAAKQKRWRYKGGIELRPAGKYFLSSSATQN